MASDAGEPCFWVTIPRENGRATLSCGGELDMATAGMLRDATEPLDCDVTIDFSEVTFCDSSGMAVLIGLHQRLDAGGHRVRVVGVRPVVTRVFELCGIVEPLGIETTNGHAPAE